jgi:F420-dependent oxidoreductase-like protein
MVEIGLGLETWSSATAELPLHAVLEAERLGFHSVWSAEAYGADALVPLAFLAARTERIRLATGLLQVAARPPTTAAMSLATLDRLAGSGRVIAGIGLSGPQVVEGWYGQPWGKPLTRMRDYVTIMRQALRREGPVQHDGPQIAVPYAGPDASGRAKALKPILHARADLPLWLAGGGPRAVQLAAELGDGWLPMGFRPGSLEHYRADLEIGLARRTDGRTLEDFTIWAILPLVPTDDVRAAIDAMKPQVAMYVGGMGAHAKNFHKEQMARCGFPEAAERVHELWHAGDRAAAVAAVPDDYLDETRLIGDPARVRARWPAWERAGAHGYTVYTPLAGDPEAVTAALTQIADLAGTRDRRA